MEVGAAMAAFVNVPLLKFVAARHQGPSLQAIQSWWEAPRGVLDYLAQSQKMLLKLLCT